MLGRRLALRVVWHRKLLKAVSERGNQRHCLSWAGRHPSPAVLNAVVLQRGKPGERMDWGWPHMPMQVPPFAVAGAQSIYHPTSSELANSTIVCICGADLAVAKFEFCTPKG